MQILLACFYSSFSQQFTITTSPTLDYHGDLELIPAGNDYLAIDTDTNRSLFYTFKLNKARHSITLFKYDKNMQLIKKNQLSGGNKAYGPFLPVFKKLNDKTCLFYYQLGEENGTIDIYLAVINPDQLEISAPRKLLSLEQKNVGIFKAVEVLSDFKFIITQSPDQSKTLLLWCSGQNNKLFYTVTDSNMNILRSKTETIAEAGEFKVQNACIDIAGNVYAGFDAEKVFVGPAASAAKIIAVDLGSSYQAKQLFVAPGSGKDLVYIAGIYKENKEGTAGAFSANLNTNSFTLSPTLKSAISPVLKDTINYQLRKVWKETAKRIEYDIIFEPIITGEGRLSLLGNSTRLVSGNIPSGGSYNTRYWGSFVYVNIDTNGPLFSRLGRRSVFFSNTAFSFAYKDKIFILYRDDERTLTKDITQDELTNKDKDRGLVPCIATITNDGSIKREVFPLASAAVARTMQVSSSAFLIPCYLGKKNGFLWATLQVK